MDFIYALGGIDPTEREAQGPLPQRGRRARLRVGRAQRARPDHVAAHHLRRGVHLPARHRHDRPCPKLTIPSPSMVHYRGGRASIDPAVYPELDGFWADLTAAYAAAGARARASSAAPTCSSTTPASPTSTTRSSALSSQSRGGDARAPARAVHPEHQRRARRPTRGPARHHAHVPGQLPLVVGGRGRLRLRRGGAVHPARGRRLLPRVRRRALGRVRAAAVRAAGQARRARASSRPSGARSRTRTTSSGASTRPRRYVPLDQLCLSPQCGFSSTVEGNALTVDEQVAKLALIVETAAEVWG